MSEHLVFNNSIQGLVDAVRERLSPAMKERLCELGLDVDRKLDPGYPAQKWASFVKYLAAELYPGVEEGEALRQIGRRTVDFYTQGLIGSALFTMLKLVGPDRTVGRMTKNLRTGSNYMETRARQLGPKRYEIWINDVSGAPGFYAGLLESGMGHSGARDCVARVAETDGVQCTYHVEWK